jgi:hypothetical protein
VTEQIVGRAGKLIGAPTCEVQTIQIPSEFEGWEFKPGRALAPGIAHGSLHIGRAADTAWLAKPDEDDNARRHVYLLALYDWCWGGDEQGLIALDDESRFYSHDHGWYLPPVGPTWTESALEHEVDTPHECASRTSGVTATMVADVVEELKMVAREALVGILHAIPALWPIESSVLECVGYFLERRAPAVAARLQARSWS